MEVSRHMAGRGASEKREGSSESQKEHGKRKTEKKKKQKAQVTPFLSHDKKLKVARQQTALRGGNSGNKAYIISLTG